MVGLQSERRIVQAAVALVAVCAAPSLALVGDTARAPVVASHVVIGETVSDPVEQSVKLDAAFRAEVQSLPTTAAPEDYEAALVYVLSQGNYPASVVMIALQRIAADETGPGDMRRAVARVQTALLARRLNRGTAAITGGGFSFVGSGFSAPVTVSGGGSTTYSS